MSDGLKGKRVLVTGGGTGIGAGIVRAFAAQGARVGVHYRKSAVSARELVHELAASGTVAEGFQADLFSPQERDGLVASFCARFGGIDVLVNNAGGPVGTSPFEELTAEEWEKTFVLNAAAPFFLSRAAFGRMRAQDGGRIVNISSIGVKYAGSSRTLHYAAAKAALESCTRSLAREGAPHNILVNAIRPGVVDTAAYRFVSREEFRRRVDLVPMKRAGTPLDIAEMACFLASEAAGFVTGQVIAVSGGD